MEYHYKRYKHYKDINSENNKEINSGNSKIEIKKSICTICDPLTQCGLDVHVEDGQIIKIEGTKENPHNQGKLCAKGAATRQYVYHKDRLQTPLKRIGPRGSGEYVPISWEEALNYITENLLKVKEKSGPEAVVFYAGYSKWMRPFLQRLAHSFGSPNYASESSVCARATTMSWNLTGGAQPVPDLKNAACILVWSSNPFYSNQPVARQLMKAKERGAKIICVDPCYTPVAERADIHLPLKPGTDGALALGMAHVIINESLYDKEFVEKHTVGFSQFKDYVMQFDPSAAESITGVPKEKIIEAARLYAKTKPASLMTSACAVVHNTNGIQNQRAVMALVGLTGNYDVKGGNIVKPQSYIGVTAGFKTRQAEYSLPHKWSDMPSRMGAKEFPVWTELVNEAQAMALPRQIKTEQPYPIKALVAFGLNYRMWPKSKIMAESLENLDLVVDIDLFMTDSAKLADIILPASSSLERSEFRAYAEGYAIFTQPAIKPLYSARSDVEIIFELAKRLRLNDELLQAGYEASLEWILEPSGLTLEELKRHSEGMYIPKSFEIEEQKYLDKGFQTPTGKFEFLSKVLIKHGFNGLPVYSEPLESKLSTPKTADEYPFILNTGSRLPMFIHSRTFRLPWTQTLRPEPSIDINPKDAENLGVKQDDEVLLSSKEGAIKVKANLTLIVRPGVIHMYHGYEKANVNLLLGSDYLDPISGYPGYKAFLCKIEKI